MTDKSWELVLCSGAEHLEEEFVRAGFSIIKSNRNYDDSRKFANSDVYSRIPTVKRFQDRKVCIIQSFSGSGEKSVNNFTTGDRFVEALQVIDTVKKPIEVEYLDPVTRKYIELIPPKEVVLLALHLPFSKQDKVYNTGESNSNHIAIKTLFSAGCDKIITIDPHVPLDFSWFRNYVNSGKIKVLSMYKRFIDEIKSQEEFPKVIFISTPGKRRTDLSLELAEIDKQRVNTNEVILSGVLGSEYKGQTVFLIDDMVISGTTMKSTRKKLLDEGAKTVYCWITHALPYEGGKEENLRRLVDAFDEKLFVSNTVRSQTFQKDYPYCYKSCVPLIIEEFLLL